MIDLGIDVVQNTHVAAAITSEGKAVLMPFFFTNSFTGFAVGKLSVLPGVPSLLGPESTARRYAHSL